MSIGPMIRSLLKHKLTVMLLVLEGAVTSALACNVIHLAAIKAQALRTPSGMEEQKLLLVNSLTLDPRANYVVAHAGDIAALRNIPGISQVAAVDSVPLNRNNWTLAIKNAPPSTSHGVLRKPSIYTGTPGTLEALGLKLIAGRDFLPSEYQPTGSASGYKGVAAVPSLILTKGLAEKYFPDGDALGRSLYLPNGHPILVIGIVDHLLRPQPTRASDADESVLMPLLPDQQEVVYVVRTESPNREHVLHAVQTELARLDSRRLIPSAHPYSDLRDDYFSADRSMLELLCAAGTGLIFVAVISIGGLANFWVMQRRRQIGIRRALGATRTDIRRYFQLENLVLVGTGALLGAALAPFLGGLLMARFESPSLPYHYLPIAAILFCAVGQLSVLAPALGASRIAPASAMRNS